MLQVGFCTKPVETWSRLAATVIQGQCYRSTWRTCDAVSTRDHLPRTTLVPQFPALLVFVQQGLHGEHSLPACCNAQRLTRTVLAGLFVLGGHSFFVHRQADIARETDIGQPINAGCVTHPSVPPACLAVSQCLR
ncbi:hypothetical protein BAUCODRAFT_39762 [Baudoinia panamericana UAMH 10762]|uniref:Uncharacterized protein n=1 Tax=Baudoinia panamericana (strain UAMH 10762) TaxID=717646 RepID=M2MXI5_BAUPA|nr:uncharacterized protein BAUCODRAFT_39762 [Baudoinia panamericana UAMH 10762]EMC90965.1 hypothetical protein BAUCODRAFT_39762 [Baudoinia panamericana UAMH 10762]